MAIYISKLSVDSYKCIKNLNIKNLSDINIATDKDNCGKTSLLKLIQNLDDIIDLNLWLSSNRYISKYEKIENLI